MIFDETKKDSSTSSSVDHVTEHEIRIEKVKNFLEYIISATNLNTLRCSI